MLEKLNFSKKADLAIKQEIQNYQNSHNTVLQFIKEIKEDLATLKDNTNKTFSFLIQKNKHIESEIELFKGKQDKFEQSIDTFRLEKDEFHKSCKNDITWNTQNFLDYERRLAVLHSENLEYKKEILSLRDEIKRSSLDVSHSLNIMLHNVQKDIENFKRDMALIPCKSLEHIKEIEKRVEETCIDKAGITKEMLVFKHEAMIMEKKFEQIYTLIARLQKGAK
jgi:hypothetical protein